MSRVHQGRYPPERECPNTPPRIRCPLFPNPYGLLAVILTRALLTMPILFRPLSIDKPPKAPFAVVAALPDLQVHDLGPEQERYA